MIGQSEGKDAPELSGGHYKLQIHSSPITDNVPKSLRCQGWEITLRMGRVSLRESECQIFSMSLTGLPENSCYRRSSFKFPV